MVDADESTQNEVSSYEPPSRLEESRILFSEELNAFKSKDLGLLFELFPGEALRSDNDGVSRPEEYSNILRYLSLT